LILLCPKSEGTHTIAGEKKKKKKKRKEGREGRKERKRKGKGRERKKKERETDYFPNWCDLLVCILLWG